MLWCSCSKPKPYTSSLKVPLHAVCKDAVAPNVLACKGLLQVVVVVNCIAVLQLSLVASKGTVNTAIL
jgi:hypothetical protein